MDNEQKEIVRQANKIIQQELMAGNSVSLTGLGQFTLQKQQARTARNPRTGESVQVPEKTVVRFSISESLRTKVADLKI